MEVRSWQQMEWERVTDGISRKVITGEKLTIAQIRLKSGAVVPEHAHPSEQISFVVEGALKFLIGGEEMILTAGNVLVIPAEVPHMAIAVEETLALDTFSPIRQDWLDHTDTYFQQT